MERRSRHKSGKYIICMAFRCGQKYIKPKRCIKTNCGFVSPDIGYQMTATKKKGRIKCYQIWYAGYKRLVKKNEVSKLYPVPY